MQFVASSVKYDGKDSGIQGKIAVRITVSQKDSAYFSDVYVLESPLMKDSIVEDFYDVVRFAAKPGNYLLKVELSDILNPESKAVQAENELIKLMGTQAYKVLKEICDARMEARRQASPKLLPLLQIHPATLAAQKNS